MSVLARYFVSEWVILQIGSDYTFMLQNYISCFCLVTILGKALGSGLLPVKSSSCRQRCYTLHSAWRFIRLLPELQLQSPSLNIFSISSIGRPLVSGTRTRTNNNATTEITPNIRNVHDVPIACVKDRKDCATIRFDIQLVVAAMPPHTPRYLGGYISELTIHGTVPIRREKNMIYSPRPVSASHP
ncbi:unnamed protein product [Fraxinus pennsylvanica]|uniref:Uncharacterized protein n=1 Tax=Fraxinus pennsylvanica TaxID=56036 RepID=A0AAD1Z536_9LAMI|nr:unnamed protein product [Fraxinus pennsylvanica]